MDVLIEQYYFRLPKQIRELPEAIVIFEALWNNRRWDSEIYISDLASTEKMNYTIRNLHFDRNRQNITDFRIRKLDIANFRKFHKEQGCPYQISCLNDDKQLCSLFLVGKNSSGKTSIYTALEYLLTPTRISTMKQRNIQNRESFLPYGNMKLKDIELKAVLNDGNGIDIEEPLKLNLSLIPFFCSDYDVQEIQGQTDLETVFARNLGFGSIDYILNVLEDTKKRITNLETPGEDEAFTNVDVDVVQADLFYLGGYKAKTNKDEERFAGMIRMLDVLAKSLAKVDVKKIVSLDSTEFAAKLKVTLSAWDVAKELNALSLYQSKKQQMARYQQIDDLLRYGNVVDAEEIYEKVETIEAFAVEVARNASFLYKTFSGGNPASRREVALKAILDIGKLKQEMDRQELIRKNAESIKLQSGRIENVNCIYDAIYSLYEEDKDNLKKTSKELIVKLLNEFTMKDHDYDQKETIDIIENEDNGRLKSIVRNKEIFGEDKYSTPERFYNSFRYKLYCISIKVVMAFMTMKMKGINAPLIFDDVFTASDFDNTVNISKFFEIVFRVFKEIEEKNMSELQIIMFTHDEVVLNSMADILDNLMADGMKEPPVRYITGVLMNPNYIDEHEKTKDNAYSLYSRINC